MSHVRPHTKYRDGVHILLKIDESIRLYFDWTNMGCLYVYIF